MKARRFTEPCTRSISCPIVLRRRGFLPENQLKRSESYNIDEYKGKIVGIYLIFFNNLFSL